MHEIVKLHYGALVHLTLIRVHSRAPKKKKKKKEGKPERTEVVTRTEEWVVAKTA